MPLMSDDDFTIHDDECERQASSWMPVSDLPDEVSSVDDLTCDCWSEYDSLSEI
jgi:hypothetical protein